MSRLLLKSIRVLSSSPLFRVRRTGDEVARGAMDQFKQLRLMIILKLMKDGYFSLTFSFVWLLFCFWFFEPVANRLPFPDMDFYFYWGINSIHDRGGISEQVESVVNAVSLCDWLACCSLKAVTWSLFSNLLTVAGSSQRGLRDPDGAALR